MARHILDRFLARGVERGTLEVRRPDGSVARFGVPEPGFPDVAIRFISRKAERRILIDPNVVEGKVSTRYLESFQYTPSALEVVEPGTYTTVQDYPGRAGYWDIGVPPSGPMDDWRAATEQVP